MSTGPVTLTPATPNSISPTELVNSACARLHAPRRSCEYHDAATKENNMLRTSILAVVLALALVRFADAQTWSPPADSERCPSKWGADDQRGSGNHMGPASVVKAARLI